MKTKILFNTLLALGAGLAAVLAPVTVHAQNLYVTVIRPGEIFEYTPSGVQSTYATGLSAPRGLAFDSIGNLFVSTDCFCEPGSDTILEFTPSGVGSTFATGLTNPRGLAFDSSGNLFVAESNDFPDGDILKFPPGGGSPTVFASGLNRPQFLTFGPPR